MPPGCSTIRGRPPGCAAKLTHQLCGKRALPLQSTQSRPSIQSKTAAQGSPLTLPKNAAPRPPTNSAESTRQPNRKVFTKAVKQTAIPTSALPRFLHQKYTSKKLKNNMIDHKNPPKSRRHQNVKNRAPRGVQAAPGRLRGGSRPPAGWRNQLETFSWRLGCLWKRLPERSWEALGGPGGSLWAPNWAQETSRSESKTTLTRIKS